MRTSECLSARSGFSLATDEEQAVAELCDQLGPLEGGVVVFFCSGAYDLDRLGGVLASALRVPALGCTAAGWSGPGGVQERGLVGVSLQGDVRADVYPITDLSQCYQEAASIAESWTRNRVDDWQPFGLLLVDGLSMAEEAVTAALYQSLGKVPLVGGSAGDDLKFRRTHVFVDGGFRSRAAVVALIQTRAPFYAFKFTHFTPTETRLVITRADPSRRLVCEINGEVAIQGYARALGVRPEELDEHVFSQHPLILDLGGEQYLRSIQRSNPDGTLTMFCAIEDGVVMSIATSIDPVAEATRAFERVNHKIPDPQVILACDCIQRRLEYERRQLLPEMANLLSTNRVVAFFTYGEQFNAVHINQTFTGVAIGR